MPNPIAADIAIRAYRVALRFARLDNLDGDHAAAAVSLADAAFFRGVYLLNRAAAR